MATNKVTVSNKAEYDQAIIDQRILTPKPFYLKKAKVDETFAGDLTFTDKVKTKKTKGDSFGGDSDAALDFLLSKFGATLN